MALPRNDSSSIISSLQMDYGDSDEEESDSKNNSTTDIKNIENKTDSSTTIKSEPVSEPVSDSQASSTDIKTISDSDIAKAPIDVKPELLPKTEAEDSPVDFISDDDDDNSNHHHKHHHHHHKDHHLKEEEGKQKDILSDTMNTDSPASQGSTKQGKKATILVSYDHDEDAGSDDEGSEDEQDAADSNGDSPVLNASDASILSRSVQNMAKDDIKIPPEPPGKCLHSVQRKIEVGYHKMINEGVDHNRMMQEKKNFRNPSIYEKLIDFCHINENGTNFPPEIYNPHVWGKESFYDELDKAQRKDMERREKEKKDRTKIEFMTGTKKPICQSDIQGGPDEKKRKTKWDAQPGNIQVQYAKLPAAHQNPGVVNLTATATGTKGKVISAVGALSKKAAK